MATGRHLTTAFAFVTELKRVRRCCGSSGRRNYSDEDVLNEQSGDVGKGAKAEAVNDLTCLQEEDGSTLIAMGLTSRAERRFGHVPTNVKRTSACQQ